MSEQVQGQANQAAAQAGENLTDHDYDGIREYDNPMPGWWVAIFWLTVVFSAAYFVWYHTPGAPDRSVKAAWAEARAEDLKQRFAKMGELRLDEASLLGYMANPEYLAVGEATFKGNCISCHGPDGQGLVGPNLTDDAYKNIKKLEDIPGVIVRGAANGAMPSWEKRLEKQEIALVAAYVASLRGKSLPGRGPEGTVIPAWPKLPEKKESKQ